MSTTSTATTVITTAVAAAATMLFYQMIQDKINSFVCVCVWDFRFL